MHKFLFVASIAAFLLPVVVSAHETRMYEINGVPYEIVVGSLNEPVIVDDKTGVSIELVRDGEFLTGVQESLQAEMIAGDVRKVVTLSPVYGAEGQYKSPFIATVPTTLTYRFFGELEGVPVDVSFTCNPAGHPQSEENTERIEITEGVTQTLARGAFGCPQEKEAFGFPEAAPSSYTVAQELAALATKEETTERSTDPIALAALIVSLIAAAAAYGAFSKKR